MNRTAATASTDILTAIANLESGLASPAVRTPDGYLIAGAERAATQAIKVIAQQIAIAIDAAEHNLGTHRDSIDIAIELCALGALAEDLDALRHEIVHPIPARIAA